MLAKNWRPRRDWRTDRYLPAGGREDPPHSEPQNWLWAGLILGLVGGHFWRSTGT